MMDERMALRCTLMYKEISILARGGSHRYKNTPMAVWIENREIKQTMNEFISSLCVYLFLCVCV